MLLIDGECIRAKSCDFIPFWGIRCDLLEQPSGAHVAHWMMHLRPLSSQPARWVFSVLFILIGGLLEIATCRFSMHHVGVVVVGLFSFKIFLPLPLLV